MKLRFIFYSTLLFIIEYSYCQDNLYQKYSYYRKQTKEKFVVRGIDNFCSVYGGRGFPLTNINIFNNEYDSTKNFKYRTYSVGDGTMKLGWYMGILATEYELLRRKGEHTNTTLLDLYYAMKAFEGADIKGDIMFYNRDFNVFDANQLDNCAKPNYNNYRNGFFTRSVHDSQFAYDYALTQRDWVDTNMINRLKYFKDNNKNYKGDVNDFAVSELSGGFSRIEELSRNQVSTTANNISKDHITHLLFNFALIKKIFQNRDYIFYDENGNEIKYNFYAEMMTNVRLIASRIKRFPNINQTIGNELVSQLSKDIDDYITVNNNQYAINAYNEIKNCIINQGVNCLKNNQKIKDALLSNITSVDLNTNYLNNNLLESIATQLGAFAGLSEYCITNPDGEYMMYSDRLLNSTDPLLRYKLVDNYNLYIGDLYGFKKMLSYFDSELAEKTIQIDFLPKQFHSSLWYMFPSVLKSKLKLGAEHSTILYMMSGAIGNSFERNATLNDCELCVSLYPSVAVGTLPIRLIPIVGNIAATAITTTYAVECIDRCAVDRKCKETSIPNLAKIGVNENHTSDIFDDFATDDYFGFTIYPLYHKFLHGDNNTYRSCTDDNSYNNSTHLDKFLFLNHLNSAPCEGKVYKYGSNDEVKNFKGEENWRGGNIFEFYTQRKLGPPNGKPLGEIFAVDFMLLHNLYRLCFEPDNSIINQAQMVDGGKYAVAANIKSESDIITSAQIISETRKVRELFTPPSQNGNGNGGSNGSNNGGNVGSGNSTKPLRMETEIIAKSRPVDNDENDERYRTVDKVFTGSVAYTAATNIKLTNGFKVANGASFSAKIAQGKLSRYDCPNIAIMKDVYKKQVGARAGHSDQAKNSIEDDNRLINIYPNPATNTLKINSNMREAFTITFYNFLGQIVKTIQYEGLENEIEVDLSNFQRGVHLVECKNLNFNTRKKLLIE